jgi:hypothetical protein
MFTSIIDMKGTRVNPRIIIALRMIPLAVLTATIACTGQETATLPVSEESEAHTATPRATPAAPTEIGPTSISITGLPQEDYEGPVIMLLTAGGQEQMGGLGVTCVASPTTGYCVDSPITLPSNPIVLKSDQEAAFRTIGDFNPMRLTLYFYKDGANLPVSGGDERVWAFDLTRDAIDALRKEDLALATETTFDSRLEPGEYVLILNGLWSQEERNFDVTYGFTVSVSDS